MAQASFSAALNNCDSLGNWLPFYNGASDNVTLSVNSTGQYEGSGALNLGFFQS